MPLRIAPNRPYAAPRGAATHASAYAVVDSRLTSACRESSRVCCTTIGTSDFEDRRISRCRAESARVVEIVEAQMQRAARRDRHPIGPDRLAIGEEHRDPNLRVAVAGVEDAGRLVRDQRAIGKRALRRNVAFGNGPALASDGFHCVFPKDISNAKRRQRAPRRSQTQGNRFRARNLMDSKLARHFFGSWARGSVRSRRTGSMRALTVAPGVANSARVEDVAEPPLSDGAVLVRTVGARRVRHRSRNRVGRLWLGAAGARSGW